MTSNLTSGAHLTTYTESIFPKTKCIQGCSDQVLMPERTQHESHRISCATQAICEVEHADYDTMLHQIRNIFFLFNKETDR